MAPHTRYIYLIVSREGCKCVNLVDSLHTQESLVVMNEVNAVLMKMFASGTKSPTAEGGAPEGGGVDPGSLHALGTVDEEESAPEVCFDNPAQVPMRRF